MDRELLRIAYLLLRILDRAVSLGLCLRYNWVAFLALPVDGGLILAGKRLIGANKTLRGILVHGVGTTGGMALQADVLHRFSSTRSLECFDYSAIRPWLLGFCLGVAAMLSELPNSIAKRRRDIAPGAAGDGIWAPAFYVFDQVDLLLGTWLVFAWVMDVTLARIVLSLIFMFLAHQLVTVIGYGLGMRKTIRWMRLPANASRAAALQLGTSSTSSRSLRNART